MSPRLLVWDIENSAALGWFWGSTYNTNIIDVRQPSRVMSFAAKWAGEKKIEYRSDFHDGHEAMIARAWELLDEADALISYNGRSHDTPHVATEILMANDGKPPSPFTEIDLYAVVKKRFKFQKNRMDFVAQELGIGSKVAHEGFGLWLKCMDGDAAAWKRFKEYNVHDVELTEQLYYRLLPWIPPSMHPHLGLLGLSEQDTCGRCGGTDLEKRGFKAVGVGIYQQLRCRNCGSWSRTAKAVHRVDVRPVA